MNENTYENPIHKIFVDGYKGLHSLEIINPSRISYFVGPSGSGKSSVLESIQLLSNLVSARQGHPITIKGFSKYSLANDFTVRLEYEGSKSIGIHIPQDTDINNGGSFGLSSDTLRLNNRALNLNDMLQNEAPANGVKLISSRYVTSFAETIEHPEYLITPENMNFNFNQIAQSVLPGNIVEFLNKYYPLFENEKVNNIYSSIYSDKAIQFEIVNKENNSRLYEVPFALLSGGLRSLTRFYFGLQRIIKEILSVSSGGQWIQVILIEEPENGLYPKLHKKIPEILEDFINIYPNLIFFVTTHSPFVISAAANYASTQKTYLFKSGQLVNSAFDPDENAKNGYTGKRNLNVVAELLGAGFSDLGKEPKSIENINIIYCEGAGKSLKDSEIYNIIFPEKKDLFISCGGLKDVVQSHNLAKGAAKFVFGERTSVLGLVDRSFSPSDIPVGPDEYIEKTSSKKPIFTDEERNQFLDSDPDRTLRMLKRKEIENYLFDPSVVSLLDEKDRGFLINLPTQEECINDDIKEKVKGVSISTKKKLAELINKHREKQTKKIYEEIKECLAL